MKRTIKVVIEVDKCKRCGCDMTSDSYAIRNPGVTPRNTWSDLREYCQDCGDKVSTQHTRKRLMAQLRGLRVLSVECHGRDFASLVLGDGKRKVMVFGQYHQNLSVEEIGTKDEVE